MNGYTDKADLTGGTFGSSINMNSYGSYSNGYCQHRLPCGYCTMLNRVCPMQNRQVTYTSNGTGTTVPAIQVQTINPDSTITGTVTPANNPEGVKIVPIG